MITPNVPRPAPAVASPNPSSRMNLRQPRTPLFGIAAASLLLSFTSACGHEAGGTELPTAPPSAAETGPTQVSTQPAAQVQISATVRVTGNLRPVREADLGADVIGRITDVLVDAGDHVEEGQLLLRINAAHARANRAQAEASASGIDAQIAQLDQDIERLEPLVAGGVVAGAELDRLRSQRDTVSANRRAASAAIRATSSTLPSYEVRAPFAGIVEDVAAEVGEIAIAGGPSLVRVIDLSTVEAELSVPESKLALAESNPSVTGTTRAYGETIGGRVVRIGSTFRSETHAAPVVVAFDNADGRLRAGMFIEVELRSGSQRTAVVLDSALVRGSAEDRYTFVVQDGTVERRSLTVEPMADGRFEVLTGLAPGEAVVSASSGNVSQGQAVEVAALTEVAQ